MSCDRAAEGRGHNLHLIHEFVLEEATEHHADEQPLRHRHARGAPEVGRIEVHGYGLAGHLRGSYERSGGERWRRGRALTCMIKLNWKGSRNGLFLGHTPRAACGAARQQRGTLHKRAFIAAIPPETEAL